MGTWSYTIMGNTEAWIFWSHLYELVLSSLSSIEKDRHVSDDRIKQSIEDLYEDLVKTVIESKSRLAYQVFGVFLMEFGATMTAAVRELILIHSRWENEEEQLFDEKDKAERFYHLSNFREIISNYRNNVKTSVFYESPASIVVELRKRNVITSDYPFIAPPQRTPISYSFKSNIMSNKDHFLFFEK
ncbi:MAG: hypothetical protein V3V33_06385 [Candidatus Lokiarchaeia archaeon]